VRYSWILCLLVLSTAFAQTVPQQRPPQQKPTAADDDDDDDDAVQAPAAPSTLARQAPVITIKGICDHKASKPVPGAKVQAAAHDGTCETVVSRGKFEEVADAIQPGMPAAKKQQLGSAYSDFLVRAHEARKLGLDKSEHFEELMAFTRLQILTQELDRYLHDQAAKISDQDVSDYYRKNAAMFEQATLQRIFIPRPRQTAPAGAAGQDARDAMKQRADSLRARVAAGEDFETLQKEAFATAGLKGTSPTSMGVVRRSSLPDAHAAVFELKPGEVSQVISDSTGQYVYRMVSVNVLPLEQVKGEITESLQVQRLKELNRSIQRSAVVELNEAYFAPAAADPASGAATAKTTGPDEHGDTVPVQRQ
jgi:hypothetical protein